MKPTPHPIARWKKVKELGRGGQGTVFKAIDTEAPDPVVATIEQAVSSVTKDNRESVQEFAERLREGFRSEEFRGHYGALKILHAAEGSALNKSIERMKREVAAYKLIDDQHIAKILDDNLDERWFVTEFYDGGTLADHQDRYRADFLGALRAIRPIVAVVAKMHAAGLVHRDIKPGNIFIQSDGTLVLGDLGLVFFEEGDESRLTDSFENVGTRDYMPAWAYSQRVEDVRPSFDVFSLGKVLWAMVAGRPACPLWHVNKLEYQLETMFPKDPTVRFAKPLFSCCVVEDEKDCLRDAKLLLFVINNAITAASNGAQPLDKTITRLCRVCGTGRYAMLSNWDPRIDPDRSELNALGLQPRGGTMHAFYACDHCGHVQIFYKKTDAERKPPAAWREWE